jgi:hypothetical protein
MRIACRELFDVTDKDATAGILFSDEHHVKRAKTDKRLFTVFGRPLKFVL